MSCDHPIIICQFQSFSSLPFSGRFRLLSDTKPVAGNEFLLFSRFPNDGIGDVCVLWSALLLIVQVHPIQIRFWLRFVPFTVFILPEDDHLNLSAKLVVQAYLGDVPFLIFVDVLSVELGVVGLVLELID